MARLPYKSKIDKRLSLDKRNKAFHKLGLRDQRREIALDQIQLLLANPKYRASKGSYWNKNLQARTLYKAKTPEQLQEKVINCNLDQCSVCARGAIMVSQIRLGNRINPRRRRDTYWGGRELVMNEAVVTSGHTSTGDGAEFKSAQKNVSFTGTQLAHMEHVYEKANKSGAHVIGAHHDMYGVKYPYSHNTKACLVNILLQVMERGDFKITDNTDYITKYRVKV